MSSEEESQKQNKIWENYEECSTLGLGAFGKVYKAKDKKTNRYVAIKELDKARFRDSEKYLNEPKIMKELVSENIVGLIDTLDTEEQYYIIMELCLINLDDFIKMRQSGLSDEEVKEVLIQLNKAFSLMHKKDIIHRDLKLSNILISLDKVNKPVFKLSDFGLSKALEHQYTKDLQLSLVGTPTTMAPEVLKGENMNRKSDIWSLGVLIYYMINREYPFNGITEYLIVKSIEEGLKLKLTKNKNLNDLIQKMLCANYENRIGWDDYFAHPFFKEQKQENKETKVDVKEKKIEQINLDYPIFDIVCQKHKMKYNYFCNNCNCNICGNCIKEHNNHKTISFSNIGFAQNEIKEIENVLNDINKKINNLNSLKENLDTFLENIKKLEGKNSDKNKNMKKNIIDSCKILSEKITIKDNTSFVDLIKSYCKSNIIKKQIEDYQFKKISSTKAHQSTIFSMDCFPNGNLISVSGDQTINIWKSNLENIQEIRNAHKDSISFVSVKDDNNFVTCSDDNYLILWISKDKKFIKKEIIKKAHSDIISKVIYCSNGTIISSSYDKYIKIWEIKKKTNKYDTLFSINNAFPIHSILYLEDKKKLISSGEKETKIIDYNNKKEIKVFDNIECYESNSLSRIDDDLIIIGSKDKIYVISVSNKNIVKEINCNIHSLRVYGILNKGIFFVGGDSNDILIYRSDNYNNIQKINGAHKDSITGFIELKDGKVASFGKDENIIIWG
jgi:serine/threonine protein kinase